MLQTGGEEGGEELEGWAGGDRREEEGKEGQ